MRAAAAGLWLAASCLACLDGGSARAAGVATSDGLELDFNAGGQVVSCRIDGRELLEAGARGGLFVADVQDIPALEVPLLDNGGFERIESGQPAGWTVGPDWQLDRQQARGGRASMRVFVRGPQKRTSGCLAIEVPVRPNTAYRASLWMRTQGCAPTLYIVQYDAEGKQHPDYPQLCISHGRVDAGWFELGRCFTTEFFCRRVRLYCNVWNQEGMAWVDDVSLVSLDDDYLAPQRPVEGAVRTTPQGAEQTGEAAGLSLRLAAAYQSGRDFITVDGRVEDTSGRDRAVSVSFRLPLSAAGWTWFNDLQNEQAITEGVGYGAARLLGERDPTQRRTIGLYPFAAMGDGRAALALAVPMDQPRAFRLGYDARLGYYVNYEFGLTRAAAKFPGRAGFRFFLYRVDPRWGFRSAAGRYYESHPHFFVARSERQGPLGGMVDCQAGVPSGVVPAFADFNWQRRERAAGNRRELAKLLRYTEFIGWWGWALGITPDQAQREPAPEEAWAQVEELARRDPPNKVALSILNCALHDREGRRRLHGNYEPRWGGYNYLCNPDPEITGRGGRVNRFTLTYEREVSEVDRFQLDGMRYDNPVVFATDNFRREHFRWADHPLVFDHVSKKPVIPLDFSSFECAKAIADDMHARGKLVGSNYTPVAYPSDIFRIPLLDIVGSETLWTWPTNAKLALQRALAGRKIVSMSWQEAKRDWPEERIEREMKQAMFYGTFYHLSTMSAELDGRWSPLIARLAASGWQPVTHARCPALGAMVERFGSLAARSLHFTMRNEAAEAKAAELAIDAEALELRADPEARVWLMRGAGRHEPLAAAVDGPRWRVKLTVAAKDTVVLRVGARRGLALDHLFLVPDHLRRAANYRDALGEARAAPACANYEALARRVQSVREALAGREVRPAGVRAELCGVAEALAAARAEPQTSEGKAWRERLCECTEAARRGVVAAIDQLTTQ